MKERFMVPSSPTLSTRNDPWHERMGSLKRGLSIINRPLPETPKSQPSSPIEDQSSRSETPKSAFDNIQRPPSVALEKIKSKANATLDRMQLLQQRYRQQKEQMERERSGSTNDQVKCRVEMKTNQAIMLCSSTSFPPFPLIMFLMSNVCLIW